MNESFRDNLREEFENRTGIVGDVLRQRRKAATKQKETAAELSKIQKASGPIRVNAKTLSGIEKAFIQVSENLQIINKWADAQVTTYAETRAAMESEVDERRGAGPARKEEVIRPPEIPEVDANFNGLVKSCTSAYSNGAYNLSVSCEDNTAYFALGQTNFKPS
ncbi:hypothetical protein EBT25_11360, partial [bacterium]|nr:hypothetical protein [bacterium]